MAADNVVFAFVAASDWRHCFLGDCSMFSDLCQDPGLHATSRRKRRQALQRHVPGGVPSSLCPSACRRVWEVGITAPFSMVPVATPTGYRALMGGWPLGMHIMSFNFSTHWRLADILSPFYRGGSGVSGVHPPLVFVAEAALPPPPGLLLQLSDPAKSSALSKAVRLQVAASQPTWSPPSRPSRWPEAQEVWLPAGLSWVSLVNSPSSSPEWSEEGTQPGE